MVKISTMDAHAVMDATLAVETRGLTKRYPLTWKRKVLVALDHLEALVAMARQEPETQVITCAMFARADLGFMILTPDLHGLNALEKRLTSSLGPDVLVPEFTYLSMTEKSEYTQKD